MLKSKNPEKLERNQNTGPIVALTTGSVFGSVLIFQDFCFSSFLIWISSDWEEKNQAQSWKSWFFREFLRLGVAKIMKIHGGLFVLNFYRTVSLEGCFCLSPPFCLWSKSTFYFWFLYIPLSAKLKFDMPSLALSLTLSLCKAQVWHVCFGSLSLSLALSLSLKLKFDISQTHTLSLLIYMYRSFSLYLSFYLSIYLSISLSLSLFKLFVFCMLFFSCYHVSLKVI